MTIPVGLEKPDTFGFLREFIQNKVVPKLKEVWNRPIMAPTITKEQHLEQIRSHGGDPSHWEDQQHPPQQGQHTQLDMPMYVDQAMQKENTDLRRGIATPGGVIRPSNYGW